jgi:hypothetical protein
VVRTSVVPTQDQNRDQLHDPRKEVDDS